MTDTYDDTPATPVQEHRFPCDSCGSDLRFDPGDNRLICDHCGNTQPLEARDGPWGGIRELDFKAAVANALDDAEIEETRVITCPNCSAQTEFDTRSDYAGQRGTHYYETKTVMRDGKRQQRPAGARNRAALRGSLTMCLCSPQTACRNATPTGWSHGTYLPLSLTSLNTSRVSAPKAIRLS